MGQIQTNELNILAVSDIHLDSYKIGMLTKHLESFCKHTLKVPKDIDVITIAGDLGHYNNDNKNLLQYLSDTYEVPVLFTGGNHDLYLVSNKQKYKYNCDSFTRLNDMIEWADSKDTIHYLDGDTITIKGVTFGGVMGWYDGSYGGYDKEGLTDLWRYWMNDSKLILDKGDPYDRFDDLFHILDVENKIKQVIRNGAQYLFTHVCPINHKDLVDDKHKEGRSVAFYFNKAMQVDDMKDLKYVQFGHIHERLSTVVNGVEFFNAALGYCFESTRATTPLIKTVRCEFDN